MNTIHDVGGMDGFTIPERDQGRILKKEWERQSWGMRFAVRGTPGYVPGGRAAIESMPPDFYLNTPYYALRMYRVEKALIAGGFVTEAELADPDGPITMPNIPDFQPGNPAEPIARLASDDSRELEAAVPPLFSVGDDVIVKNEHPKDHTRVPRYVRGHHGIVHRHHGVHRFQDHVDGKDVGQQHLYTVMFTGPELWGSRAHPKDVIYAELWDYHLQPAA